MTGDAPPFVHPAGLCESTHVGSGTRVWAFAHILPGARIGRDCNVCDHVFIENDVVVGDAVTIKCGVQLWDGLRVGDNVFIGPNATFTNDLHPRSKQYPETFAETVIGDGASIGANATILPGIRIGRGAMVGAGAVVTRDVPAHATVVGNPARVIKQVEARPDSDRMVRGETLGQAIGSRLDLPVKGCFVERLPHFVDPRGSLVPLEAGKGVPFTPQRLFLVNDVPGNSIRGEHAHRACEQFLIAAHGALAVSIDDGATRAEIRLDDPTIGLYLAPMTWGTQYDFTPDGVLLVAASHTYDADDYIRDYDLFISEVGR
ncbi:WxcM-like domain-containing protein [Sphingomonas sp.]|uniref:WxcM-like domain-containing protein n=1 Tax=Sphingomonas sp. TaxID=28214 RepID=UPI0025F33F9F|nr:WxcM-like domain-containing protein [Sphingomonas sp.]